MLGGTMVEGWTVVDCCIDSPGDPGTVGARCSPAAWSGLPILRVIVTHMHPDHIGLAHWLCERWNVRLWISATDYQVAQNRCVRPPMASAAKRVLTFTCCMGCRMKHSFQPMCGGAPPISRPSCPRCPPAFAESWMETRWTSGAGAWRCISGYGHAPEHMALFCAELTTLISGDMVLPRISTNVSVHASEPEANPLQLFLTSLLRYLDLPESTLVLPSHGKPFIGLATRIANCKTTTGNGSWRSCKQPMIVP